MEFELPNDKKSTKQTGQQEHTHNNKSSLGLISNAFVGLLFNEIPHENQEENNIRAIYQTPASKHSPVRPRRLFVHVVGPCLSDTGRINLAHNLVQQPDDDEEVGFIKNGCRVLIG